MCRFLAAVCLLAIAFPSAVRSQSTTFPPKLPGGEKMVTVTGAKLLQRPAGFPADVAIARVPPKVEFLYFPGQDHEGKPWSNWGDGSFAGGKYYSAIGDHLAPRGNAFVWEYDPEKHEFRKLCETAKLLNLPEGHYMPGKIHTQVSLGSDGWVYFATHRGSTKVTTDANHFVGEWILRANPKTGDSEVVVQAPVPKHCIPNGSLDPDRLIFYGGTAPGVGDAAEGIVFFAYDLKNKKLLTSVPNGPARAMILSRSTGRVYYTPGNSDGPLMRFDPATGKPPEEIKGNIGVRAATAETAAGKVFTISQGRQGAEAEVFAFDVKTETIESLGPAAVGKNHYIAAVDVDPSGRYLYYVPGAHGSSDSDGSPIVQFDTKTRKRKVIAFLHPAVQDAAGCATKGTYSVALDDKGERLFITWNVSRGGKNWDACGLTVVHIPAEERQ